MLHVSPTSAAIKKATLLLLISSIDLVGYFDFSFRPGGVREGAPILRFCVVLIVRVSVSSRDEHRTTLVITFDLVSNVVDSAFLRRDPRFIEPIGSSA